MTELELYSLHCRYYICCLEELHSKKKHKGSVTSSTSPIEICGQNSYSFKSAVEHAIRDHSLDIKESRDCCVSCDLIYTSTKQAICHLLIKVMNYQHQSVFNSKENGYCVECIGHFKKLKEAFDHFFKADFEPTHGTSTLLQSSEAAEEEKQQEEVTIMEH